MARIKGKDIYLNNDDQIYFGDNREAALWYNYNDLLLDHTISGVDPIIDGHLATKRYVQSSGVINHGYLNGLENDDHLQYIPVNGSRGFTSTVSGVEPIEGYDLATRDYVIGLVSGQIPVPTVSGEKPQSLIQFNYTVSLPESSTNSTSFIQKLRLTVSGIPIGNYRVGWTFSWRQSKANTSFLARIQLDDSFNFFNFESSPYVDINYWNPISSFYYHDITISGTHNIDLDYRTSTSSATAYIKDTKLEFWRIQ